MDLKWLFSAHRFRSKNGVLKVCSSWLEVTRVCVCVLCRGSAQCCSVCYPLCVFIVLAACLMACAGLIWMQIALKEDLDSLKEKLRTSGFHLAVHFLYLFILVMHKCCVCDWSAPGLDILLKCKHFNFMFSHVTVEMGKHFDTVVRCLFSWSVFLLVFTVESSQKASSHEIPKLSEDLKANQRTLEDIESGDKGLNKLWANLTDINRKVRLSTSIWF